jgi:hypothetical protein
MEDDEGGGGVREEGDKDCFDVEIIRFKFWQTTAGGLSARIRYHVGRYTQRRRRRTRMLTRTLFPLSNTYFQIGLCHERRSKLAIPIL